MYYEKIFKVFKKHKIKYIIAGGLAVNLYGVPRFTKDVDILIDITPINLSRLKKALIELGYTPKAPVSAEEFLNPENWSKWKKEKGLIALNFYNPKNPYQEIDLLINTPLTYMKAKKDSKLLSIGKLKVNLIGVNDLIAMKRKAKRAQDLSDIEMLKKTKRVRVKK